MQVITVSEFGGPEVLKITEAPLPKPGPGEVLVRVLAAGVGPWDVTLRRGGWTGSLPYVPGGEFAGVVVGDTGADAALDDGTPVYGYPGLTGCYAQYVTCPVEQLAPIPEELSAIEAAAAPIDAITAEQGLTDVLATGPGDRVLITAGAGGLGHFAVQIARILGASVVATASPQHHEFLHRLGADTVIDHTKPDWPEQVRGVTDAETPDAQRVRWQQYNGQPSGTRLIHMAPWFDDESLVVILQARYDWQDAAEAHRVIERGHTQGKLVLVVDDDLAAGLGV